VACSNGLLGKVTVYNNLAIPGFVPISPARMAFTATDGSGAHEDCWLDNVDLTINGVHLAPVHGTGPPQIVQQTGNVTASAGATFTVAATGPLPYTYQWLCNGWPIGSATQAGAPTMMNFVYRNLAVTTSTLTIPATTAINGATYSVAVSNAYGVVTNSGATLTMLAPYFNPPAVSNGYNSKWLSFTLNNWAGGALYSATSLGGPWAKTSNGTNSQFNIPIAPSTPQCFYRVRGSNSFFVTNYTRFYSTTSFWNIPIGANPPIESNSTTLVQNSLGSYTSAAPFDNREYGVALAYACATNKVYTVPCTLYGSPSCTPGGLGVQFPIPAGTTAATGTDGHLVVVYQALDGSPYAGKELDMWGGAYNSTNDTWSARTVVVNDLYGWGATCPRGGQCNGANAAGFSLLGGAIRPEEIAQGHIDHALALDTPLVMANYIACPATHTDGQTNAPYLPEGALIQLDPSYNVDAQNWPQWVKIIAHALQTYGAYSRSSGGAVSIYGVSDQNAGVPLWTTFGVPEATGNTRTNLSMLPWLRMRVIQYDTCGN
jgi:hypothetical protein